MRDIFSFPLSVELLDELLKLNPYLDLEIILAPDGTIFYADPSHQEFLIKKVMEIKGWNRQQVNDACPPEFYGNFLVWLIMQSGGYIPVWPNFVWDYPMTKAQYFVLKKLKIKGLYTGKLPSSYLPVPV